MVASKPTTQHIVDIVLKHVDRKTALRMAREIVDRVHGNQSVTQTFHRIVEELIDREE